MKINWLELKLPPVALDLLVMISMWWLSHYGWLLSLEETLRHWIFALVTLSAAFIVISGVLTFYLAKTTVNPTTPERASVLVTSGIYQYTRNPMYLGMAVFLAGWAVLLNSLTALFILPFFILYMTRFQIIPEERILNQLFGTEYQSYSSKVRRWI